VCGCCVGIWCDIIRQELRRPARLTCAVHSADLGLRRAIRNVDKPGAAMARRRNAQRYSLDPRRVPVTNTAFPFRLGQGGELAGICCSMKEKQL
jgi:hypothetical protein